MATSFFDVLDVELIDLAKQLMNEHNAGNLLIDSKLVIPASFAFLEQYFQILEHMRSHNFAQSLDIMSNVDAVLSDCCFFLELYSICCLSIEKFDAGIRILDLARYYTTKETAQIRDIFIPDWLETPFHSKNYEIIHKGFVELNSLIKNKRYEDAVPYINVLDWMNCKSLPFKVFQFKVKFYLGGYGSTIEDLIVFKDLHILPFSFVMKVLEKAIITNDKNISLLMEVIKKNLSDYHEVHSKLSRISLNALWNEKLDIDKMKILSKFTDKNKVINKINTTDKKRIGIICEDLDRWEGHGIWFDFLLKLVRKEKVELVIYHNGNIESSEDIDLLRLSIRFYDISNIDYKTLAVIISNDDINYLWNLNEHIATVDPRSFSYFPYSMEGVIDANYVLSELGGENLNKCYPQEKLPMDISFACRVREQAVKKFFPAVKILIQATQHDLTESFLVALKELKKHQPKILLCFDLNLLGGREYIQQVYDILNEHDLYENSLFCQPSFAPKEEGEDEYYNNFDFIIIATPYKISDLIFDAIMSSAAIFHYSALNTKKLGLKIFNEIGLEQFCFTDAGELVASILDFALNRTNRRVILENQKLLFKAFNESNIEQERENSFLQFLEKK